MPYPGQFMPWVYKVLVRWDRCGFRLWGKPRWMRGPSLSIPIVLCVLLTLPAARCRAESYNPFDHLWYGTRDIPDRQNVVIFAVGSAATLAALALDHPVQEYFARANRLGDFRIAGNFWGTGIPGTVLGVGTVSIGLILSRRHEIDAGEAHLEGLVANAAYTGLMKLAVDRPRPNSGRLSFPSGHTSTAFVTAGSLMDMYGISAGAPALALGMLTAASRLASNVHWLSDTVFGAALGLIVGHAYTRHHLTAGTSPRVTLIPFFETRSDFGITIRGAF